MLRLSSGSAPYRNLSGLRSAAEEAVQSDAQEHAEIKDKR